MNFKKFVAGGFVITLLLVLSVLTIGCDDYDDYDHGTDVITPGSSRRTEVDAGNDDDGGVTIAEMDVNKLRVYLDRVGESEVVVVAEAPPARNTAILLQFAYWGDPEDEVAIRTPRIAVTVPAHTNQSDVHDILMFKGVAVEVSILPFEDLVEHLGKKPHE